VQIYFPKRLKKRNSLKKEKNLSVVFCKTTAFYLMNTTFAAASEFVLKPNLM